MNFKSFSAQIGIRLAILFLLMTGLAFTIAFKASPIFMALLVVLIFSQIWGIYKFVNRTNQELVNFITGIRFDDYTQSFTLGHLGETFQELEAALTLTLKKVKLLRAEREQQAAYFQALVSHMPLPLFFIFSDNRVELLNNASRRAFNVPDITNSEEFQKFGAAFARDLDQIEPGESFLGTITVDDIEQQFIVSATQINVAGKLRKLISMQDVQSQLDATELATWQNLLRVTSHEILNSLSPVSSLAKTAQGLVEDFKNTHQINPKQKEDIQDIQDALNTLVRRSEGLSSFVQSYRQMTKMPPPEMVRIPLRKYLERLKALMQSDLKEKNIRLDYQVTPKNLELLADEGMLDQALINLIKNSFDAMQECPSPKIFIKSFTNLKSQVVIEVMDNGPGIPSEKLDKIFVPFFTTKREGSGVGLTLVRYIMLSHGGNVRYIARGKTGATFRLTF